MRVRVPTFVLGGLASALSAQPITTDVDPIIVHGNPSERYRIPEALRRLPAETTERWRKQVDRDLSCQHAGPRGCGTPLVPLLTLHADGTTEIGAKPDRE